MPVDFFTRDANESLEMHFPHFDFSIDGVSYASRSFLVLKITRRGSKLIAPFGFHL